MYTFERSSAPLISLQASEDNFFNLSQVAENMAFSMQAENRSSTLNINVSDIVRDRTTNIHFGIKKIYTLGQIIVCIIH